MDMQIYKRRAIDREDVEDIDWDFLDRAFDIEREWKKSLPRYTNRELLEIFPEAKSVIPVKINEWQENRRKLLDAIRDRLIAIRQEIPDKKTQQANREWLKITDGMRLLDADKQIARLRGFLAVSEGLEAKGWFSDDNIQNALKVPVETFIEQPLKRSGKTLVGFCPFHNDKHPSFFIYPNSNSCWCFGCNQGGDVIKFVKLLYGFNFKQAVKFLLEK